MWIVHLELAEYDFEDYHGKCATCLHLYGWANRTGSRNDVFALFFFLYLMMSIMSSYQVWMMRRVWRWPGSSY